MIKRWRWTLAAGLLFSNISSSHGAEPLMTVATDGKQTPVAADALTPETPKTVEPEKRKSVRAKGEITFDDLAFDIQKDGEFKDAMLTDDIKSLHKQTVRIRGFILPNSVFQQSGIKQFVLVRDNKECCFGPGAAIYDCVIVEMEPGKTADFSTRIVTVTGKFEIDTEKYRYPDGPHYAIFKLTATEVR